MYICFQNKQTLEKAKQTLEAENQDLCNDLKSVQMAKTESERKRKQVEQQLQEAVIKLQETERSRGDSSDKASKLGVSVVACLSFEVDLINGKFYLWKKSWFFVQKILDIFILNIFRLNWIMSVNNLNKLKLRTYN
jgi:hypothetical protein